MGVRSSWFVFCSSRATSAPASPAPMMRARRPLSTREADCSLRMRRAKREPPIRTSENSQSMTRAVRGIPGWTSPAAISASITPPVRTDAVETATAISFSSFVLAYIHRRR